MHGPAQNAAKDDGAFGAESGGESFGQTEMTAAQRGAARKAQGLASPLGDGTAAL